MRLLSLTITHGIIVLFLSISATSFSIAGDSVVYTRELKKCENAWNGSNRPCYSDGCAFEACMKSEMVRNLTH